MPSTPFQTSEYYHLYNRGVEKREIFLDTQDYQRFLFNLREFNNEMLRDNRNYLKRRGFVLKPTPTSDDEASSSDVGVGGLELRPLVKIIAYCLNPNHYHILAQQLVENGISLFMKKIGMGYAKYFNTKYRRSGYLFQGKFKSSHIKSFERLVWLSAYVNGNPEIHQIAQAQSWLWSSYREYLNKTGAGFCDKSVITQEFDIAAGYKNFVDEVIQETKQERKELADDLLEGNS